MSIFLVGRAFRSRAACAFFFLAGCVGAGAGQPAQPPAPPREAAGGPYCGVYSVYAALRAVDVEPRFGDLLDKKYVGSFNGSTLGELQRAATDFGGHAEPMQGLSAAALRASQNPIVLHVRRPGLKMPYAHWVVFLGMDGDKARIVDPPNSVELLPFAELLSLWHGTGLVVARQPVRPLRLRVAAWAEMGVVLLMVVIALAGVRMLLRGRALPVPRFLTVLGLIAGATVAAITAHLLLDEGILHNRAALAQVVGHHFEPPIPSVTVDEVERMVGRANVTFIDARFPRDYADGHLKGAINLPIHAGLVDRARVFGGINSSDRVVVYCQSERCSWGNAIASDLLLRGLRDVSVFSGGWQAWDQRNESGRADQ